MPSYPRCKGVQVPPRGAGVGSTPTGWLCGWPTLPVSCGSATTAPVALRGQRRHRQPQGSRESKQYLGGWKHWASWSKSGARPTKPFNADKWRAPGVERLVLQGSPWETRRLLPKGSISLP